MGLTVGSAAKTRIVKATRGVAVDGHYYGVFVVTPSFSPDDVQKITRTTTSGRTTVSR